MRQEHGRRIPGLGRLRAGLQRLDPIVAAEGERAAARLDGYRRHQIRLEVPPSAEDRPRWGHGRGRHEAIGALLDRPANRARFAAALRAHVAWAEPLLALPLDDPGPGAVDPAWYCGWLSGMDILSLYGEIRTGRPHRYVEVGSGWSTRLVARARRDGSLATAITSIDPKPRVEVDALCDLVVRQPLELADLSVFTELEAGDVVFFDGSHRVFTGSDVTVFYLEVLPRLADGVIVGIHDILWPDDYLPEWRDYWFSEQYLLGALLLAECPWLEPRLACAYAAADPELAELAAPVLADARLPRLDRRGFAFWSTIRRT